MRTLRIALLMALFSCIALHTLPQQGIPYITNIEIPPTASSRSWAITQGENNQLFLLNRRGIFAYDDYTWERLPIPGRPLSMHFHNKLFFSTENHLGYAKLNNKGIFDIHFIKNTIQDFFHSFVSLNDTLYAAGYQNLAIVDPSQNQVKAIFTEPDSGNFISHAFALNSNLYLIHTADHLVRVDSTGHSNIPLNLDVNEEITFIFIHNTNAILGTSDNRLISFDGQNSSYLDLKDNKYIEASFLTGGISIDSTQFALATQLGGCLIINSDSLTTEAFLNIINGLPDDEIYSMGTDNRGGLWLSHAMGLSRVDPSLPVKSFHHLEGLSGNIHSVASHDGSMYVGSTEGVFKLVEVKDYEAIEVTVAPKPKQRNTKPNATDNTPKKQDPKEDSKEDGKRRGFFSRLFSRDEPSDQEQTGGLFRAFRRDKPPEPQQETEVVLLPTKKLIYSLQSITHQFNKITGIDGRCWQLINFNDNLIAVTSTGIYQINDSTSTPIISGVYALFAQPSSYKEGVLYFATNNGVWLFNASKSEGGVLKILNLHNEMPVSFQDTEDEGILYLTTEMGLYKLLYSESGHAGIESIAIPEQDAESPIIRKINSQLTLFTDTRTYSLNHKTDSLSQLIDLYEGDIVELISPQSSITWLSTNGRWAMLKEHHDTLPYSTPPYIYLFDEINYVYQINEHEYYLVDGYSSLFHFTTSQLSETEHPLPIYPRQIEDAQGKKIEIQNISLSYSNNGIKITLSAPFFIKKGAVEYRHYIEGLMAQWSDWSSSPVRDFPYLPNGRYSIKLQARDIFGNQSVVYQIPLRIAPPFWRTFWFIALCILLGIGLLITLIKAREKKLKYEKKILQQRVDARTRTIEEQKNELMKQRDELANRNMEIEAQRDEIEAQRDRIVKQNEDITKSIEYAKRIQTAVMPSEEQLNSILPEYFLLFRPRDIVSGDFYWINRNEDSIVVVVADCTGHGVPGAFMSMLGVSFLNEIVSGGRANEPYSILNELRALIKSTLSQSSKEDGNRDGMDAAVCVINLKSKTLQFAGAYNPMYIIRNGELTDIKPDKMPVGIHLNERESFTNNALEISQGEQIYLFSDGYVDQFGGNNGRKFMSKNFKRLLIEVSDRPMDEQKRILEQRLDEWQGNEPQVDDTIVLGIRF